MEHGLVQLSVIQTIRNLKPLKITVRGYFKINCSKGEARGAVKGFNNFAQGGYDFDAMENKALGRSVKKSE